MSPRHFSISLSLLSALIAAPLQPGLAQEQGAPTPTDTPRTRGEGGRGEGRRGEGGGGERPRGEGGRGGPGRGEGGPGRGEGGPRPDETPAQFRERVLSPYLEMVPDLTEDQKTHILAILDAINAESRAVRENKTLSEERQRIVGRALRADAPNRIKSALTEAQLGPYEALLAEQAENAAEMAKVAPARPEEDVEQMRERVLKGYQDVLEELSVKQKTAIIKILESAAEDASKINSDTTQTAAQKRVALLQIHDSVGAKVIPLLDADQQKSWKRAHDAQKPQ